MNPLFLGIDTSLTGTGIAWLGARVGAATLGQGGITKLPLHLRVPAVCSLALEVTSHGLHRYGEGPRPQLALIEAPDTSNAYGGLVERIYLTCRVTEILMSVGVPVGWVPSAVLKGYCIGKGGGKVDGVPAKKAVKLKVMELWPENAIANDNEADATVLAAMAQDIWTGVRRVPDQQAADWLRRPSIEWPPMFSGGA